MKSTIYDVAEKAKTSIATVSRVLNHFPGVSPAKRQAVLDAIEQLAYVPSGLAQNLATSKTNLIAVYMPYAPFSFFESKYYMELYRGMDQALSGTDYSLVILNDTIHTKDSAQQPKYLQLIQKKRIDGLIFSAIPEGRYAEEVFKMDFPVVYVGKKIHAQDFNVYAGYDEYMCAIFSAALTKGHEKILFFTYAASLQRVQSIAKAFIKQNNLPKDFIQVKDTNVEWSEDLVAAITQAHVTLLVIEPLQLVTLFLSFLYRNGIAVPEDVSIMSIEYVLGDGCLFAPEISCVYVPAFEMGYSACQMLLNRLENIEQCNTVHFESKLHVRVSFNPLN